ncbi:MAG TPA: metallophosphoesterase family protein [Chitinophagaceae bacterium]|nr:metallophosphoesterase family protein [Chitinophagaceae bacterium]
MRHLFFLLSLSMAMNGFAQNSAPPQPKNDPRFKNKPLLIRGPYLQVATDTSMVVRWRTDASTRSRVRYGTVAGNLNLVKDELELKTEHEIKLSALQPQTKYYYSIGSLQDTLQYGPDTYFYTLPPRGNQGFYRVGVFGDPGSLSVNQANVRDQFVKYLGNDVLNAWILLGDNAYNDGSDMEYQAKFFTIFQEKLLKKYPVFPNPGNHDYHDVDFTADYAQNNHSTAYYQNFSMPVNGEGGGVASHNKAFYSFDLGNIHFLSLDSYGKEENTYFLFDTLGPQVQWVKKDLEANRNTEWVIAFWHHPPYSMGTHNSDSDGIMTSIRQNFIGILERYGVDLIICGHSHVYERSGLMNNYFGKEADFDEKKYGMSPSSGLYNGSKNSCPYIKDVYPARGTVYIVSGTSSYVGKPEASFPHAAMRYSNATDVGAGMLEVQGNRLDFKWICADGVIRDQFTMMKDVNKTSTIRAKKGQIVTLTASFISDKYNWNKAGADQRTIEVIPPAGKTVYTVQDKFGCLKDRFEVEVSK